MCLLGLLGDSSAETESGWRASCAPLGLLLRRLTELAVMPYGSGAVATVSAMPVPSSSRFSAGSYRLSSSLSSSNYYTSEYRSKYSSPSSSTSSVASYGRRHLSLSDVDSGLGASSRYASSASASASGSSYSLSSSSSRERSEAREPAYRSSSRSRADSSSSARGATSAAVDAIQDLYNKYSPSAYLADRPPRASTTPAGTARYSSRSEVIGHEASPPASTVSSSPASSSSPSSDDEAAAAGAAAATAGGDGQGDGGGEARATVAEVRRRLDAVSTSPPPAAAAAAPADAADAAATVSVILQNGTRVRRRLVVTPGPEEAEEGDAAAGLAVGEAAGSGAPPPNRKAQVAGSSDEEESSEDEGGAAPLSSVRRRASQGPAARYRTDTDTSGSPRLLRGYTRSSGSDRGGLVGLRNIGNTCFMNSVIQCLSNTKPLLEYLLNDGHLADINTSASSMKGALIKAFTTVIQELWHNDSNGAVVNTTALKSQIQRFAPRFMGYSQQDAQEFLRYLLEGLHEDVNRVTVRPKPILTEIDETFSDQQKAAEAWKRYLRVDDSKIVDIFVGQLKSTLRCTVCGHCSVTFDPFWDLSLPIPVRTGQVRLQQCLDSFSREEVLDGDEKPTCSKCQMRRKCTKSFTIQKFPKILVLHLKRFSPTERFRGKLNVTVDFPLSGLDLSAYAANRGQGCTYNLYGVANHSGTTYSGHYTAYCKHPYTAEWHEYNDSRVSTISSRSIVSSEGYVLFYELFGHTSHL